MMEWHNINDEKFEETGNYLLRLDYGDFFAYVAAWWNAEKRTMTAISEFAPGNVTHWMRFNPPCSDEPLNMTNAF